MAAAILQHVVSVLTVAQESDVPLEVENWFGWSALTLGGHA